MCQVALDRAARLATRLNLPGNATTWAAEARHLAGRIIHDAWDERMNSFTEHLGERGGLDASLLALPLRRVSARRSPAHGRHHAVDHRTPGAGNGLLYRYLHRNPPTDSTNRRAPSCCAVSGSWTTSRPGPRRRSLGAVRHTVLLRQPARSVRRADRPPGPLLPRQLPQALSHVGLLSSAVVLARAERGVRPELSTHAWFQ
ncbi:hypothetical protein [Streptomyces coeruleorubidus]|uniref:hypothetical protein n=1 Tax=Streptomyces coeruleorubidus TaxID=116188 RepID=UPI0031592E5A